MASNNLQGDNKSLRVQSAKASVKYSHIQDIKLQTAFKVNKLSLKASDVMLTLHYHSFNSTLPGEFHLLCALSQAS